MYTIHTIEKTKGGWLVIANITDRDGSKERRIEYSRRFEPHKTRAEAERFADKCRYALAMAK